MRPNELLQRLPHAILPVTCLFLHKFLLSSISLSVSLLFPLCSPSPVFYLTLLPSLPAHFSVCHTTPPPFFWLPTLNGSSVQLPSSLVTIIRSPSLLPPPPFSLLLTVRGVMEIGWETRRWRKLQVCVSVVRRRCGKTEGLGGIEEKMGKGNNMRERLWKTRQELCSYALWHIGIHRVQHAPNNNANHNMHMLGCC